jgi:hypothetical protein
LIDARSDSQLWGARFRRSASDLCTVQRDIAREICNRIRDQLARRGDLTLLAERTSDPPSQPCARANKQLADPS